jgi:hypothetical protein
MDGTENEHADIEVKGFPTILFFSAEKGAKPVSFEGGDRSLKALTKFIKKHAKVPFEVRGVGVVGFGREAALPPALDWDHGTIRPALTTPATNQPTD